MARTSVIFHRIGPYHQARLSAASNRLQLSGIQGCGHDDTYAWEQIVHNKAYSLNTLFAKGDSDIQHPTHVFQRLAEVFEATDPAVVVVPGWSGKLAISALRWCVCNHVSAVIMSESTAWDEPRVAWKEWIKWRIIGLASTALVGGHPHADYIHHLGMPKERIFLGYDAVDNAYFAVESAKWQKLKPDTLKAEIGGQGTEDSGRSCQLSVVSCQEEKTEDGGQRAEQTGCSSNIQHPPYFLASNRFIEKKNLFRLLEAYARYRASYQLSVISYQDSETTGLSQAPHGQIHWDLCMLGDGALKPQLLTHCQKLGLHVIESAPWEVRKIAECRKLKTESEDRESPPTSDPRPPTPDLRPSASDLRPPVSGTVYFPGFRQIDELPRFYAHAGAFVHASTTEQWGLVVNEAMACGLPVIVSNRVGCAQDLVQEGVNGFTFDPYDVEQLAGLMQKVSSSDFPLSAFGDASRTIIADWGPERFAAGLKQAVECALQVGPKRASLLQRLILRALLLR